MSNIILNAIVSTAFDLIAIFAIISLFSDFMRWKKSKEIIMIDIFALFDIIPILKRGVMWAENNKDKSLNDYLKSHLSEALPKPPAIIKALNLQERGHRLVFYTEMPNCVRPQIAKYLNEWKLKGDLCLNFNDDFGDAMQFRELCVNEFLRKKNTKIIGVIDEYRNYNIQIDEFFGKKGIKVVKC